MRQIYDMQIKLRPKPNEMALLLSIFVTKTVTRRQGRTLFDNDSQS